MTQALQELRHTLGPLLTSLSLANIDEATTGDIMHAASHCQALRNLCLEGLALGGPLAQQSHTVPTHTIPRDKFIEKSAGEGADRGKGKKSGSSGKVGGKGGRGKKGKDQDRSGGFRDGEKKRVPTPTPIAQEPVSSAEELREQLRPVIFPSLVHLSVKHCNFLSAVVVSAPALQRVTINNCTSVKLVSLTAPGVRLLDLAGCSNLTLVDHHTASNKETGVGTNDSHQHQPCLRSLTHASFRHCARLDEQFFFRLVDNCRMLSGLDVYGTVLSPVVSKSRGLGAKDDIACKCKKAAQKPNTKKGASAPALTTERGNRKTKSGLRKLEAARPAISIFSTKQHAQDRDRGLIHELF